MRKHVVMSLVSASILAALAAVPASAQSKETMRIEIPFEFILGEETLRAGVYVIERLDPTRPNVLRIKSAEGGKAKNILTQRVEARDVVESAKLLFHRYGEQYYLAEVWMSRALNGQRVPAGKGADESRSREVKVETVAVYSKAKAAPRR